MSKHPSPRVDQLRALREAKFARNVLRQKEADEAALEKAATEKAAPKKRTAKKAPAKKVKKGGG